MFATTKHPRGWHPIHLAVLSENVELVKFILDQQETSVRVLDQFNGDTKVAEALKERAEEFGEFMSGVNTYKAMPLHYACYTGNWDIINLMIERGAAFDDKDTNARMPFDYFNLREVEKDVLQSYVEAMDKWTKRKKSYSCG